MTRLPLRPGQGAFPDDQIPSPYIPSRSRARADGVLRMPHGESVLESYRSNVVRIWPTASAPAVDLVPGATSPSASPADGLAPLATILRMKLVAMGSAPGWCEEKSDLHTRGGPDRRAAAAASQRPSMNSWCWRQTAAGTLAPMRARKTSVSSASAPSASASSA